MGKPEASLPSPNILRPFRLQDLGGTYVAVFACVVPRATCRASHTSQKTRCMRHPAPFSWLMGCHKTRYETAKIKIRKTNLECPLESTDSKSRYGGGA